MGASRPGRVVAFTRADQTLGGAVAAFLAQPDLAASTRRSYQQTLDRLERALGSDQPSATLTTNQVTAAVTAAWDGCAPATRNRHVATVRSFTSYCRRRRWLIEDLTAGLDRRVEPADRTKAIPLSQLEQLWRHDDMAVREKALWRFCMRPPPEPPRPCRSMSRTLTWTTSGMPGEGISAEAGLRR
jgi:site-specific recombinase XerD